MLITSIESLGKIVLFVGGMEYPRKLDKLLCN